jgi:hypothetical protein
MTGRVESHLYSHFSCEIYLSGARPNWKLPNQLSSSSMYIHILVRLGIPDSTRPFGQRTLKGEISSELNKTFTVSAFPSQATYLLYVEIICFEN